MTKSHTIKSGHDKPRGTARSSRTSTVPRFSLWMGSWCFGNIVSNVSWLCLMLDNVLPKHQLPIHKENLGTIEGTSKIGHGPIYKSYSCRFQPR